MSKFDFKYFGDKAETRVLLEFEGELVDCPIVKCTFSLVDNRAFLSFLKEDEEYVYDMDTSELSKEDLDHIIQTLKDIREGME